MCLDVMWRVSVWLLNTLSSNSEERIVMRRGGGIPGANDLKAGQVPKRRIMEGPPILG